MDLLTKPLEEITYSDLQSVVNDRIAEGDQVEFKSDLPTKSGKDKWMDGQKDIGTHAKNAILEEVVAFANAHGGVLLVGIEESPNNTGIANAINPVPKCSELASRFKLVFRDGVEPALPLLEIRSIEDSSGNGVLLIRVGKSREAPHRVKSTRECTVRRMDRCEKMSMREIQDLTLNTTRGLDRLRNKLEERKNRFRDEFNRFDTPENVFGVRVTGLPTDEQTLIARIYSRGNIDPNYSLPHMNIGREGKADQNMNYLLNDLSGLYRPVLRGARKESTWFPSFERFSFAEVYTDGLVEIGFLSTTDVFARFRLEPDWIVGLFGHVLAWIRKIRQNSMSLGLEYALEASFVVHNLDVKFGSNGSFMPVEEVHLPEIVFPLYSFDTREEIKSLLVLFQRDLLNLVGWDTPEEQEDFYINGV